MNFASFGEFVHMGGHAVYVWSSYAITAVVMAGTIVLPLRRHRKLLTELRQALGSGEPGQRKTDQDIRVGHAEECES